MYERIVIHDTREWGSYLQATDSVCKHSVPCDILFLLLRYFRDTLATIFLCKSIIQTRGPGALYRAQKYHGNLAMGFFT